MRISAGSEKDIIHRQKSHRHDLDGSLGSKSCDFLKAVSDFRTTSLCGCNGSQLTS